MLYTLILMGSLSTSSGLVYAVGPYHDQVACEKARQETIDFGRLPPTYSVKIDQFTSYSLTCTELYFDHIQRKTSLVAPVPPSSTSRNSLRPEKGGGRRQDFDPKLRIVVAKGVTKVP